jgi:tripartite ATP-independent transporter DctM subunit
MVDEGFDEEFSACVTISSSTIGPIIPPSIPAVVYAMVANVSVGRLLFGGVVPGFLMGAVLMAYVYVVSKKSKYPKKEWISWKVYIRDLLYSFIKSLLPMLTPAILLGSIYTGIVTTTEAAALAVLYSLILGFILYRTMNVKAFVSSLKSVFITSGSILLLLPAAKVFSFVMTKENLQNTIYSGITSFAGDNKILIGACIILLFLVLGCLSDPNVNIMLFVPMVLPLILAAGFDPIHMGVVIIVTAMIGNITPPVGIVLQTTTSIEKLSFEKVSRALIPFIILLIVFVIVLAFIPQIILFLPNLILG